MESELQIPLVEQVVLDTTKDVENSVLGLEEEIFGLDCIGFDDNTDSEMLHFWNM